MSGVVCAERVGEVAGGGGGGFPGVTTAPVVYNAQVEIRQMLIDWVTTNKVIDASVFSTEDWKLVANGQPVTITG